MPRPLHKIILELRDLVVETPSPIRVSKLLSDLADLKQIVDIVTEVRKVLSTSPDRHGAIGRRTTAGKTYPIPLPQGAERPGISAAEFFEEMLSNLRIEDRPLYVALDSVGTPRRLANKNIFADVDWNLRGPPNFSLRLVNLSKEAYQKRQGDDVRANTTLMQISFHDQPPWRPNRTFSLARVEVITLPNRLYPKLHAKTAHPKVIAKYVAKYLSEIVRDMYPYDSTRTSTWSLPPKRKPKE